MKSNKTEDGSHETVSAVYDLVLDYQKENNVENYEVQKYSKDEFLKSEDKEPLFEDAYFETEETIDASEGNEDVFSVTEISPEVEVGIDEIGAKENGENEDTSTAEPMTEEVLEEALPQKSVNIKDLISKTLGTTQLLLQELVKMPY